LVNPDTVSSTVDMLIFSHSDDMEFSVPEFDRKAPYTGAYLPQMNSIPDAVYKKNIGGAPSSDISIAPAEFCIGERFSSLLQLLKMSTFRGVYFLPTNSSVGMRLSGISAVHADITGFDVGNGMVYDHYTNIASCFLLARGGFRVNIDNANPIVSGVRTVSLHTSISSTEVIPGTLANVDLSAGAPMMIFKGEDSSSFLVPQYTVGHSRVNRFHTELHYEPIDVYSDSSRVYIGNGTGVNGIFRRAVADDCSLGYFIGVPEYIYDFVTNA